MPPLLLPLFSATFLQQAYAVIFHFRKGELRNPIGYYALPTTAFGCLGSILYPIQTILSAPTSPQGPSGVLALTCNVASLSLFAWATATSKPGRFGVIFGKSEPQLVVTNGPYAYIRHPTYTAYALGWLGGILMRLDADAKATNSLTLYTACGCFATLLWIYYMGAEQEEREFLVETKSSDVRSAYEAYRRVVTARWVPGLI